MNTTKNVNPALTEPSRNKLNKIVFIFYLFTFVFILAACNTTEPPPGSKAAAELSVEDASSTEVWLNVKLQNVNLPAELKLFREDSVTQIINLGNTDTLLYDTGLLPNKTYKYKVAVQQPQQNGTNIQSQTVTATTMDTTSHNFTWQTYTFGGANGSSVLNDVAIINENDIWAVGEIHTKDTDQWNADSSKWIQPYNAVHWDGNSWELKRALFSYQGTLMFSEIRSILAFASNDIWFEAGIHWNGVSFETKSFDIVFQSHVNSMWGTSSNDFYVVGNNGNIAHYNGSEWTKITSGTGVNLTDLNINDIWGDYNEKKGEYEILAVGGYPNSNDRKILKIASSGVVELPTTGINWSLGGIWFKSNKYYYTAGDGIYYKHLLSDNKWDSSLDSITRYYTSAIRGVSSNDIMLVGSYGEVLHYNGITWKSYKGNALPNEANLMRGISYIGNTVCIVGSDGSVGIIYLGKRN